MRLHNPPKEIKVPSATTAAAVNTKSQSGFRDFQDILHELWLEKVCSDPSMFSDIKQDTIFGGGSIRPGGRTK